MKVVQASQEIRDAQVIKVLQDSVYRETKAIVVIKVAMDILGYLAHLEIKEHQVGELLEITHHHTLLPFRN